MQIDITTYMTAQALNITHSDTQEGKMLRLLDTRIRTDRLQFNSEEDLVEFLAKLRGEQYASELKYQAGSVTDWYGYIVAREESSEAGGKQNDGTASR